MARRRSAGAGRAVLDRARLLKRIAVLQFGADKANEARITQQKGLDLAGSLKRGDTQDIDGRDSRYKSDVIVELEATELEVAAVQAVAGKLVAAIATAQKYAEELAVPRAPQLGGGSGGVSRQLPGRLALAALLSCRALYCVQRLRPRCWHPAAVRLTLPPRIRREVERGDSCATDRLESPGRE